MTATGSATVSRQPVLSTPRLVLRPFTVGDGPDVERLAGDRAIADTTQNIPHPYPTGAATEWIATHQRLWATDGSASFAVTLRTTGELVGGIGLLRNSTVDSAEIGYWIGVPFWGQGYATEAAHAVVGMAFESGVHRVHARHLTRNPSSGRVMQKLGMQFEGIMRGAAKKWEVYEDVAVYGMLDHEWRDETASGDTGA